MAVSIKFPWLSKTSTNLEARRQLESVIFIGVTFQDWKITTLDCTKVGFSSVGAGEGVQINFQRGFLQQLSPEN